MSTFALLHLPLVAQKFVLEQMDLAEIIELSMKSRVFKMHMDYHRLKVNQFDFLFHPGAMSICIKKEKASFLFQIFSNPSESIVSFGEKTVRRNTTYIPVTVPEGFELEVFEKITKFLLEFIRPKTFTFKSQLTLDYANLFVWKYVRKFQKLEIASHYSEIHVTPEDLRVIMEDITSEELTLNVNLPAGYLYRGSCKSKHVTVTIRNWEWLNFFRISCRKLVIECEQLPVCKINSIQKRWLSGRKIQFEELIFIASSCLEEGDQRAIFKGISRTPTRASPKVLQSRFVGLDRETVKYNIRNERSEQVATVAADSKMFMMVVWNEKRVNKY